MIRPLRSADVPQIKKIYAGSNEKNGLDVETGHFSKDSIKYISETLHKCENTVFEENGKVLGIISVSHDFIEGLFVDPGHWKKGIGSALLNKVLENRQNLYLQVYEKNLNAVKFYQKHKFRITGGGICRMTGLAYFEMVFSKT